MKDLFIKQINFELWANRILLESMKMAHPPDSRGLLLFSHNLSAASMWLNRVKDEPINTTLFQERTLTDCEILMEENAVKWSDYLSTSTNEELTKEIDFVFPVNRSKRRITIGDAILHFLYHSAYHRGQIIIKLKGCVEPLPALGYVIYASKISE